MDEKSEKQKPSSSAESGAPEETPQQSQNENSGKSSESAESGAPETTPQQSQDENPVSTVQKLHNFLSFKKKNDGKDETQQDTKQEENKDTQEGPQVYYTIDDVVNEAGYGKFQKFLTFLAGLGWLADAFEVIILSIIGDMLACEWPMQRWKNALLTSVVFFGMSIGAPTFGNFADRYGRRTCLGISMLLLFILGAACAAAPDYTWMAVLRGLMGFSLGGIAQGVTLCCEYYPASVRGQAGFYLSYYWALGAIGVILTAWIVMLLSNNWRIFVFLAAVPALIVFLSMKWYPESARYYLVSKQSDKAVKTLKRLARMNKSEMPKGKLREVDALQERGKITDLLRSKMRRTTLLFWYMWLAIAMAYYGIALITPMIIKDGSLLVSAKKKSNITFWEDFTAKMPCEPYTNRNFIDLLWTTAAEFPGLLLLTFVVEKFSRKAVLGTFSLFIAFFQLVLMLDIKPEFALLLALFICRALVAGVFQLLFIMTTEAFPTTLRASAMGTGSGCARVGGLIVPILAQVTIVARPIESMSVLAAITALAGVSAFCLPVETRGKHMTDVVE